MPEARTIVVTPAAEHGASFTIFNCDGLVVECDCAARIANGAKAEEGVSETFHDMASAREIGGKIR